MFSWNEKFRLNIEAIDSQHQMLINVLQSVYEACSQGNGAKEAYNALKFLNWYVTKHFDDEEIIQKNCHYPYLEQHRKCHNFYRMEAQKIISDFQVLGESSHVIAQILVSFGTQIIHHITYEDVNFGQYVHTQKLSIPRVKNDTLERDFLTGLLTEKSFNEILLNKLKHSEEHNEQIAYIKLNIDDFSLVNQSYGYEIEAELLIYIAGILHDFFSDTIYIAHIHSNIFALLIIMDDHELDPEFIINQIKRCIKQGFSREGSLIPLSASAGIALAPIHGTTPVELIQKASIALEHAKSSGKNTTLIFENWMYEVALQNAKIMKLLQPYHVDQYIHLVFQPIYCTKTKKIVACESLLRMIDMDGNTISPVNFIPLAERNHTILNIGYLTIERVCSNLSDFIQNHPNFEYVSINLSAIQLDDKSLVTNIKNIINHYDIDPKYLAFEITESIFIGDINGISATLTALKDLGFKLLLDDFGSGYSSLTYLNRFDFDTLKVDKEFLVDILTSSKPKRVIQAIIDLAHDLHMSVIVEGVECDEELALLTQLGCDKVQGFLLSKPLVLEDIIKIL